MEKSYELTIRELEKGTYGKIEFRDTTHCPRCSEEGEAIRTEFFVITVCEHCGFSMGNPYTKTI